MRLCLTPAPDVIRHFAGYIYVRFHEIQHVMQRNTTQRSCIRLILAMAIAGCVTQPIIAHAGAASEFAADVAKKVAVDVIASVIKDAIKSGRQAQPEVVSGTSEDRDRVRNIVSAFIDTNSPLAERIGLYATKVDYFEAGVVGRDFIIKDRQYFEKRWPIREYAIRSIDDIAVAPDRSYAIARYTVDYKVSRGDDVRTGVSRVALVIGSFHIQPRIHAIKEWVSRSQ